MIGGGLAAAVSLLRVEFDVDVYEKAPQLNEVSGDIRGGVPWRRAREIVAEPMVCGLTAGGRWIRTFGPPSAARRLGLEARDGARATFAARPPGSAGRPQPPQTIAF